MQQWTAIQNLKKYSVVNLIALVCFACTIVPCFAFAQTSKPAVSDQSALIQGITIHADSMDRDSQNETVDLEGKVQVIYQDQHLSCRKAHINLRAKTIDAIGDVLVTTSKANLAGQRVILDYETNTGLIIDGYVQSGNVLFEGSQIRKLSEVDYVADDARYTTCTTCPEAWSFSGTKIRAEIGGYAYIKNSVMRFASIPVFWMPYLAVPLKTDRQSGLLTPTIGQRGLGGLTYSQSYFWAISRSSDATFNLTNYEFRGPKTLVNYRYVLTESSSGELDFGFLNDNVFKDEPRLNRFRSVQNEKFNRWFIKYQHYYDMPDGFVQRAQINTASDLQYPNDFPLETRNNGDPAMESRFSVTKNTASQHWSVDASIYQNLLQSDPLAGNENAVQRLPEIRFSQATTRLGNSDFLASLDVTYQNFARSGFAWDDLQRVDGGLIVANAGSSSKCGTVEWEKDPNCHPVHDGVYNSGTDLIRTGQRLNIQPTLSYPIRLQNLELVPAVSYNETQYFFPVSGPGEDNLNIRRYVRASFGARTTLSRIYGDFSSLQSQRIKHEIQPEIQATAVPWLHHPKHEFFGLDNSEDIPFNSDASVSDGDLNGANRLQYDYSDRLSDRKLVVLALTNKLTRKDWEAGAPSYQQFLIWRLAQTFDLYQSEKNPDAQTPNLSSDIGISIRNLQIVHQATYYYFQEVSNQTFRVRLTNAKNDFFQVEQALTYTITANQKQTGPRTENYLVSAKKGFSWLDLIGKVGYSTEPADYLTSWGYGAQLRLPGDCLYLGLTHSKVINKKPEYEVSVNFAWDGNARPPIDESVLQTFGF